MKLGKVPQLWNIFDSPTSIEVFAGGETCPEKVILLYIPLDTKLQIAGTELLGYLQLALFFFDLFRWHNLQKLCQRLQSSDLSLRALPVQI